MVSFIFVCTLAMVIALSAAGTSEYKVRVRNLTYKQPFSPPLVVAHTRDVELFEESMPAVDAVRLMAENGDNTEILTLAEDADVAKYVCGTAVADAPLAPGETWRGSMDVDMDKCASGAVFSAVAMLVNTNDAFMGIDSQKLNPTGVSKAYPPAFDAGTEENNELCTHIPGPACDSASGNNMTSSGEGFIHVHRGMHGVGDLEMATYDWRNPVADVYVFPPSN